MPRLREHSPLMSSKLSGPLEKEGHGGMKRNKIESKDGGQDEQLGKEKWDEKVGLACPGREWGQNSWSDVSKSSLRTMGVWGSCQAYTKCARPGMHWRRT